MNTESEIRGFDFHCHVDLHPNPSALIRECEEQRIAVLAVTTTPKAWLQNQEWTKTSKFVHAAAGLHPELVGQRFSEIDILEDVIASTRFVGEIGLDGSPQHCSSYSKQKEVFKRSLISAQVHGGRVMTIHSRRAARDVIKAIGDHTDPSKVLCILHWFSGSLSELRSAVGIGCYFSVNSAMLHNDRGIKLVQNIPRDRLLTETDFPFTVMDGKKIEPWNTINTCEQISQMVGSLYSDTKRQLAKNAAQVFQFAGICIEPY